MSSSEAVDRMQCRHIGLPVLRSICDGEFSDVIAICPRQHCWTNCRLGNSCVAFRGICRLSDRVSFCDACPTGRRAYPRNWRNAPLNFHKDVRTINSGAFGRRAVSVAYEAQYISPSYSVFSTQLEYHSSGTTAPEICNDVYFTRVEKVAWKNYATERITRHCADA